jgi:uncharacterized membrane-anchored protein
MTTSSRRTWLAIGALVAGQLLALGWMVWDRVALLKNGRELVLDVVPVDPRSLFRGDYVILNTELNRFAGGKVEGAMAKGAPLYVTIARDTAGKWQVARAAAQRPRTVAADEVVLKARPDRWSAGRPAANATVDVRYGIESYFMPEGTGMALEKEVGQKRVRAVVAVGRDGSAAIKGLEVDGKRVHDEPLL